jgi:hypothetical protein
LEVRRLWVSGELEGYLDLPYAAQVYRLERQTTELTTGKLAPKPCMASPAWGQRKPTPGACCPRTASTGALKMAWIICAT